ncbi:MAG TPA: hypothetical protein PK970_07895 [Hyphomicrobiaceae bacterium]|nr:hypothetical protein [Hyphomicrobiaceae bacterium]
MSTITASLPDWLRPIATMIEAAGGSGGFLVAFPQYRPTLVRAMAEAFDLAFVDFRAERLSALGSRAPQLELGALSEAIMEANACYGRGVVLHNVEALLASKPEAERRAWLASVVAAGWGFPVVVPVALYQPEMPAAVDRVCRLDPEHIPEESLLMRLASR